MEEKVKAPSSSYSGVHWNSEKEEWGVMIFKGGEIVHLGYFDNEKEAALKYDEEAAPLGKPLNFPSPK